MTRHYVVIPEGNTLLVTVPDVVSSAALLTLTSTPDAVRVNRSGYPASSAAGAASSATQRAKASGSGTTSAAVSGIAAMLLASSGIRMSTEGHQALEKRQGAEQSGVVQKWLPTSSITSPVVLCTLQFIAAYA